MSLSDQRRRLGEQQAALLRALVAGGPVPEGLDPRRVHGAARSLVNKRLREVAHTWPTLTDGLGPRFVERFRAYAERTAPPESGPFADGERFARTLPLKERTDALERQLLRLTLGRRWLALTWARLPESGRRVLGLRLPGLGVRVWG